MTVWKQGEKDMWDSMGDSVVGSVRDSVWYSVRSSMWDSVVDSVGSFTYYDMKELS